MFGLSLAELIIVLLVAVIFIKPQDLPEIAHFVGKILYRGKKIYHDLKAYLKKSENELGLSDLKHEINRGIAEEKSKLEDDMTVIVDMDGNEHQVPNIKTIRPDLSEEDLENEVNEFNSKNEKEAFDPDNK